ncbi:hypothetical protein [Pseudoalteromonas phenolica]|uniref:hypothetical protein n=1 Tax=Pseudoalteromonas phenolica TaxID=161398 RepID=UPI00384B6A52
MALSVADILMIVIAIITALIAGVTLWIAHKTQRISEQAVRLSKMQLNNDLCIKLYELKDLTSAQGGRLLVDFFSNQVRDEEKQLLYSIKDRARTLIQKEKLVEQLVNLCDFFLGESDASLKLTINSQMNEYSPKELVRYSKIDEERNACYEALYESIKGTTLDVLQELKR